MKVRPLIPMLAIPYMLTGVLLTQEPIPELVGVLVWTVGVICFASLPFVSRK